MLFHPGIQTVHREHKGACGILSLCYMKKSIRLLTTFFLKRDLMAGTCGQKSTGNMPSPLKFLVTRWDAHTQSMSSTLSRLEPSARHVCLGLFQDRQGKQKACSYPETAGKRFGCCQATFSTCFLLPRPPPDEG